MRQLKDGDPVASSFGSRRVHCRHDHHLSSQDNQGTSLESYYETSNNTAENEFDELTNNWPEIIVRFVNSLIKWLIINYIYIYKYICRRANDCPNLLGEWASVLGHWLVYNLIPESIRIQIIRWRVLKRIPWLLLHVDPIETNWSKIFKSKVVIRDGRLFWTIP